MTKNRVLLIDVTTRKSAIVHNLTDTGYEVVGCHNDLNNLHAKVLLAQPDVLIICINQSCENLVTELKQVNDEDALPIIVFTDNTDFDWMEEVFESGVISFIYKGLEPIRIPSIIEAAKLRHSQLAVLKSELNEAKHKLQSRVVIDKAKGMLMEYQKMSEKQAYRALQKTAMDQATTILDIAQQTIRALNKKFDY